MFRFKFRAWSMLLVASVLTAALSLMAFWFLPLGTGGSIWEGYYLLLTEPRADDALHGLIDRLSLKEVLTIRRAATTISALDGTQRLVSLAQIDAALVSGDPRFDGWLQKLPALFSSEDGRYRVSYIPASANSDHDVAGLRSALQEQGLNSILLGLNQLRSVIYLALFLVMVVVLLLRRGTNRLWALMLALPWAGAAWYAGPWELLLVVFAWIIGVKMLPLLEDMVRSRMAQGVYGPSRRNALEFLALAALTILLFAFQAFLNGDTAARLLIWLPALGGTGALLLVRLAFVVVQRLQRTSFEFIPVAILPVAGWRGWGALFGPLLPLLAVLAIAAPVVSLAFSDEGSYSIPGPAGSRDDLDALWETLETPETADGLPSMADLVRHFARVDALWYGLEAAVPRRNAELRLSRYELQGSRVIQRFEPLMRFDDAWLQGRLSSCPPGSVDRLLATQRTSEPPGYWRGGDTADWAAVLRYVVVVAALAAVFVLAGYAGDAPGHSGRILLPRRFQQAA